jgi:hypothetical protein
MHAARQSLKSALLKNFSPHTSVSLAGPYPAIANRPSFVAVGDGLTESAFSSEHMGWGLLLQQKYVRKVSFNLSTHTCIGAPEDKMQQSSYFEQQLCATAG